MSRWLAPGIAVLAAVWLLVIVAAPMLWTPVAGVIYAVGSFICHQLPDRSFHLQGAQLPVCARCLGLYSGGAFGSVIGASAIVRRRSSRGRRPARARRWRWTAAAATPTLATIVLEWGFGWPISNIVRAVAALPFGVAVAFVVVRAVATVDSRIMRAAAVDQVEPATNKYLVAAIAWAIPGGGHLLLRRRQKGVTFLIALTLMFATGLWLEGRIFPLGFDLSQPLVGLAAIADLGIGIPYFVAKFMGHGAGRVVAVTYEYGNAFAIVAGLLNMLVVLDAWDVAEGRK